MKKVSLEDIFSKSAHRCCNYSFPSEKPTMFGLLTFSVPLLYLSVFLYVFGEVICFFKLINKSSLSSLSKLIVINTKLLNEVVLLPLLRNMIKNVLTKVSSRIAVMLDKNFNLIFLTIIWLVILNSIALVWHLVINI